MVKKLVGKVSGLVVSLALLSIIFMPLAPAMAQTESQFFPETGKTVSGTFLKYWRENGGVTVFGFPITDAQNEVNPEDGKTYLTQWFERNRFEFHPENSDPKFQVLLGLLGKDLRREALTVDPDFLPAPNKSQPDSTPDDDELFDGVDFFAATGHNVGEEFLLYWRTNGGLGRFGYPISEPSEEIDPETGKVFVMQWFERARFESHPENRPPFNVLLGLLGNQIKSPKTKIEFTWKLGGGSTKLNHPLGIASDAQNNLYIVDSNNFRILKLDNNGKVLTQWGKQGTGDGEFAVISDVAIDSRGDVYVTDIDNNRIQKFDNNGKFLTKWGKQGADDGDLTEPSSIAVDPSGIVYVSDTGNGRIQKFDNTGAFLAKWDTVGSLDGQLNNPTCVAVDAQGNVYVGDNGNNRVQKFDSNGNFQAKWGRAGNRENQFNNIAAISVDKQGFVYVADAGNSRIQKFDNVGRLQLIIGSQGSANGQFNNPVGIEVDTQGNVYVIDEALDRLTKFRQR